ncbi:MAG: heat shock protein DnaJ domain protein [Caulobacteraceae bacterium]|nr:heat shock protein DnaJ domain protein [Caulobacteraceae bacterium]
MAQDPYQELGVSRNASAAEIRKAFHKLAKKHHPDVNKGDKASEEKFKRMSAAFDLLGDAEKRAKYDAGEIDADGRETMRAYGQGPYGGGPYGGSAFGDEAGGFRSATFEGVDLNDILGEMFSNRAGGRGAGFASRGADVRAHLDIDLEEAINGAKLRLPFSDGRVLDVTIPKGVADGQTLRLKGQGAPGRAGPGDALIEIGIRPHPIFRREGDQLVMDLPVSVPDAVLGGKVQAETPDGPVTLNVPKHSNSGRTLRLKGRGLSDGQGRRGDLLARLVVTLPEPPDPELEKFAETWRAERPYTPRLRG